MSYKLYRRLVGEAKANRTLIATLPNSANSHLDNTGEPETAYTYDLEAEGVDGVGDTATLNVTTPTGGAAPLRVMLYGLGDSLTYGAGSSDPATKAPIAQLAAALNANGSGVQYSYMNYGVGGTEMTRMEYEAQYSALPHKAANINNYDLFIGICSGGTNDISTNIEDGLIVSRLAHVHQILRDANIKTIDVTMTATNDATEAEIMTRIAKHRKLLKARRVNWQTWGANAFVDVAKDETIGQFHLPWSQLGVYTDGCHMTDTGYAMVADYIKPAVLAVVAGNSYGAVGEVWPIKYNGVVVPDGDEVDPNAPYLEPGMTSPEGGTVLTAAEIETYTSSAGLVNVGEAIEENDPRIQYTGTWVQATDNYCSGGTANFSTSFSPAGVKFKGTRLVYTSWAMSQLGTEIIIDGVLWKTVAETTSQIYTLIISGLTDTEHTLIYRSANGLWPIVDKLEITPKSGPAPEEPEGTPTQFAIEDTSTDLTFTNFGAPIDAAPYSGGTTRQAGGTNTATVSFTFEVTGASNEGVDFYAYLGNVSWRYQKNGGAWTNPVLEANKAYTTPHAIIRGFAAGTHTVVMEYSGNPIPNGGCNFDKIVLHTNVL